MFLFFMNSYVFVLNLKEWDGTYWFLLSILAIGLNLYIFFVNPHIRKFSDSWIYFYGYVLEIREWINEQELNVLEFKTLYGIKLIFLKKSDAALFKLTWS